jgi:curved DNA-binding protein CbpA
MGNAQSNQGVNQQQVDMVTQYIAQQQEMIKMQQQQINSILRHQGPGQGSQGQPNYPRIMPSRQQQQQQQQQQQRQGQQRQRQGRQQQQQAPTKKIDPYKVLGLSKHDPLDEKILKKAYIRKARKYHPDKGGNKQMFQMISIAYTVLKKKIQDSKQDLSHQELRNGSQDFLDNQEKKINPNLTGTDFDVNLFNKIFDDNKIPESTDKGYAQWMKESQGDDTSKMFNGKFNKSMFDSVFAEEKRKQEQKYGNSQVTKYEGPQAMNSNNNGQIVEVGQGEIEDFSGDAGGNLQYRDYRDAFTRSCLVSEESVDPRQQYQSVQHYEAERGNVSFELSPEEGRRQEYLENKKKEQEYKRREITKQRDLSYEQQYNKINSLLLK